VKKREHEPWKKHPWKVPRRAKERPAADGVAGPLNVFLDISSPHPSRNLRLFFHHTRRSRDDILRDPSAHLLIPCANSLPAWAQISWRYSSLHFPLSHRGTCPLFRFMNFLRNVGIASLLLPPHRNPLFFFFTSLVTLSSSSCLAHRSPPFVRYFTRRKENFLAPVCQILRGASP